MGELLLSSTGFALDACGIAVATVAGQWQRAFGLLLAGNAIGALADLGPGWWWLFAGHVVAVIVCAWLLWQGRRRRKRAPRAYGEKSRARVAALVRKTREAARPRPVLRPAPQGA